MKFTQILTAALLSVSAAGAFAAQPAEEKKVIVSTQEQPETAASADAAGSQPAASEASAETAAPAQPAQ